MDEVVQMMGGLAYMTGRPGDPLRAGTSVVDITGGMFGYIGILLALYERHLTGRGKLVRAALFETTAFLMGQHMAHAALQDTPVPPMPARVSAWSVYRIFDSRDGEPVFIGVISEKHWERLCRAFGWEDLLADPRLLSNNGRIDQRGWLLPELENRLHTFPKTEIIARCEAADIPFAPIARPEDLFDDPQLNAGEHLLQTTLPDGTSTKLPALPLEYGNTPLNLRLNPPQIGEHTRELLLRFGIPPEDITAMQQAGTIACPTHTNTL